MTAPAKKPAAARLKTWRHRLELRQIDAAPLVGLDTATYNRIERGVTIPGPVRAARIAKGTGGAVPASAWRDSP